MGIPGAKSIPSHFARCISSQVHYTQDSLVDEVYFHLAQIVLGETQVSEDFG